MSNEELKSFLSKVKGDIALQEKLKIVNSPEEVVAIAKELGHNFTADKLGQLREVSDEELENVAGGLGFCVISNANVSNVCISFDCFHT